MAVVAPQAPAAERTAPVQTDRFRYWQRRTIVSTIAGYALYYFVRKNFSLAMPGMESELGITKVNLGLFLTLNGLIYGLSRFANGFIADRVSGRVFMVIGLTLCALVNFAFGFSADAAALISGQMSGREFTSVLIMVMGLLWVLNGWLQGMGVPPCTHLLTHWIPPRELATKMSVWNMSHSIGAGLVVILCGYIMGNFGAGAWRFCFWIPAAIATVGAAGLWFALRDTPSSVGLPELSNTATQPGAAPERTEQFKAFIRRKGFGNRLIWTLAIANFFVYVVRFSVLDWGPSLLKQSKGVSLQHAGWMVAMFEIAGIAGMLLAGWVTDRFFASRAHRTCVFCMLGAATAVVAFWQLPATAPAWLTAATLCAAGFFIYGPQALLGIAACNHATNRAAATANGLLGLFGYSSTILSGLGLGYVAQHYGWEQAYLAIVLVAVLGMLVLLTMWNAQAAGYDEDQ